MWGHGRYGAHWTGDNYANWTFMRVSIPQLFSFNLFGIPFVGADICGFAGNTTSQLCSRWMQLGAFYPFSRNHNTIDANSQEPYTLGNETLETSRNAMKLRYSLLKYYYSVFCNQRGVGTVFRPLLFEFPEDPLVYDEKIMNEQFLIGSDLMVTPILYENETSTKAYFPTGRWFNFYSGEITQNSGDTPNMQTVVNPLPLPPPLFIREGTLMYIQNTKLITRSTQLPNTFNVIAAVLRGPDHLLRAQGQIIGIKDYSDEAALEEKCVKRNCMVNISMVSDPLNPSLFKITSTSQDPSFIEFEGINIESVKFYGLPHELFKSGEVHRLPRIALKNERGDISNTMLRSHRIHRDSGLFEANFLVPLHLKLHYIIEIEL
jgi:alpha-glucosidase (family GH31 glycosyl hydrolase)